jgi:DNA-binding transcriptional regulator LsrR (DeoR family)
MVREINKQDFETLQHIAEFMKNMTQRKIAPEIGISYALLTKMIY